MSEKAKKRIHAVFSIITSIILVAVGVLFIAQCIGIYNSGERPFTRESVGAALKAILIPTLVFGITVLAGGLVAVIFPLEKKKKAEKNWRFIRIRLAQLCDESRLEKDEISQIRHERTARCVIFGGGIIMFVVSLIYPAFYVFSPGRFGMAGPEAINSEFIRAFSVLMLCFIPLVIYFLFGMASFRASYQREIDVLKSGTARISKEKKSVGKNAADTLVSGENTVVLTKNTLPVSKKLIFILQIILVCSAIALIILGINNGGVADVLEKAKKVCSECIGLG